MKFNKSLLIVSALVLALAPAAIANDFSFIGSFNQDDNVQTFNFVVGASSTITLRTWSYAGGTNANGQLIARGGFDPILALFDSTGALIGQNDDGGCGQVAADALTGRCWDTYFSSSSLAPGVYAVAIMEYNNFANGPNLSNGFVRQGQGNFTAAFDNIGDCSAHFVDVSGVAGGHCRDNHWAFDILGVNNAVVTPEPGSLILLGSGLIGVAGVVRRKLF